MDGYDTVLTCTVISMGVRPAEEVGRGLKHEPDECPENDTPLCHPALGPGSLCDGLPTILGQPHGPATDASVCVG